jgi:hypothetical protein
MVPLAIALEHLANLMFCGVMGDSLVCQASIQVSTTFILQWHPPGTFYQQIPDYNLKFPVMKLTQYTEKALPKCETNWHLR